MIAKVLQVVVTAVVLFFCLFSEEEATHIWNFAALTLREVSLDAEAQWMVFLFVGIFSVAFGILRNRVAAGCFMSPTYVDLWWIAFLIVLTAVYFLNCERMPQFSQAIIILGCAALGRAACVGTFWWRALRLKAQAMYRLLGLLVGLLAITWLWEPESGSVFFYGHNTRWVGPWTNPNMYGLLMGLAIIVSSGLGAFNLFVVPLQGSPCKRLTRVITPPLVVTVGMASIGLLKSYCRGAWVSVAVAVSYLLVQWLKRWPADRIRQMRIGIGVTIALFAVAIIAFWHLQNSGDVTTQRVISMSNQNDLSWRNRVAAWEGALQMMSERPGQGSCWNQQEPLYDRYYSTSRLDEKGAIQLNDYLVLGATFGIPALFCFCMYLWLSFTRKLEIGNWKSETAELAWLKTVCRAGALVLAVGFWFDGGLFKLPTAATFWILLELGRD